MSPDKRGGTSGPTVGMRVGEERDIEKHLNSYPRVERWYSLRDSDTP
eukprot:gene8290-7407_t